MLKTGHAFEQCRLPSKKKIRGLPHRFCAVMELKPHDLQEHSLSFWFIPLLLLILLSSIAVAGQSDGIDGIIITEEDFQALVAIKRALQDPRNALKSWNESSSGACSGSWVGIKCAQGQVIAMQLPGKGLGGRLAEEIGQLIALRKINLHTNFIRGQIPPSLAMLRNLRGLYLFQNRLSGSLPPGLASSPVLQALDLSRNQLSGAIPRDFATSPRLFRLDLSFNNLVAGIPPSLASLKGLKDLRLRNNQLQGSIPSQLGHFSGLLTLDLSYNHLNGSIPTALVNLSSLISLSLAHNNLTGSLLKQLNRLQKLQELNVSSNNLSGTIPPELGKMTGLAALDLSRNNFNGRLPLSLNGLTNLSSFDCSYNNLSGPVPAVLRSFGESSFTGNVGVCGLKTDTPCSPASPLPIEGLNTTMKGGVGKRRRFNTVSVIFVVVGSVAAGIFLLSLLAGILWQCGCMYILLICCRKRPFAGRKKGATDEKKAGEISSSKEARDAGGGKLVHFDGSLNFSADDMLCATAEVLGKSTYGTVYKAMLEDGNQVAVKRLREGIVKSQRDFETEVIALGAIRHPNLLALRAYYWGAKGEKLLVYDYMPGGSLAAFLHARGPETPLDWQTRINIAVGAARGLAYLHNHEKMIHGHLTSSNILLDSQMGAKLSDFGLSRLMTTTANSSAIATASALGYRAPELTKLRKATTKSDVYSFGIVLLELLTGKAPGEAASTETGMDLPEWVASKVKEEWTNEIFDLELMKGVAPAEEELISTLQLAMNCVVLSSSSRPEMDEVAHQLEEMKPEIRQPSSSAAV